MFHGAVVEHAGRSDARVFKEVAQLGSELKKLGVQTLGGKVVADVALLFDWNAWWAVAYSSGPSVDLDYHREAETMYAAISELGYTVDVVSPAADLSKYKLVITSCLKMLKPGIGEKLEKFVSAGGTLISTFFSGIVDETDRAFQNGYPGPLAEVLGIWVEETDALAPDEHNEVVFADPATARFRCGLLCDRVHLNGAKSLAHYGIDFYKGTAAVTENHFGAGLAYYIATRLEKPGLQRVLRIATEKTHLKPTLGLSPSEGLEAVCRVSASGEKLFYLLNHKAEGRLVPVKGRFENLLDGKKIDGEIDLAGYGVALLKPL